MLHWRTAKGRWIPETAMASQGYKRYPEMGLNAEAARHCTTSAPTGPEFPAQELGDGHQVPLESRPEMESDRSSASQGPWLRDVFVWQRWRGRRPIPVFARTTRRLSPCAAGRPGPPVDIRVPCSRPRTSRTSVHCFLDCLRAYRSTCEPRYHLGRPDRHFATWCPR